MSLHNQTINETIANWIIFIAVVAVMFGSVMSAISNAHTQAQEYKAQAAEYEEYLGLDEE